MSPDARPPEPLSQEQRRARLAHARSRQFEDGSRPLVLIIGTGLHFHLKGLGIRPPETARYPHGLYDWNALMGDARRDKQGEPEFDLVEHEDATATWESLVSARCGARPHQPASYHEGVLLHRVDRIIREATPHTDALASFGQKLARAGYRDLITLNFDQTLEHSLAAATGLSIGIQAKTPTRQHQKAQLPYWYRRTLCGTVGNTRVWHPHGMVGTGLKGSTLQLGQVSYGKSVPLVSDMVRSFRNWQRRWQTTTPLTAPTGNDWSDARFQAWQEEHRALGGTPSWIDQSFLSDVVFIGCGMDRAELDLWLFLHLRQRQFSRVSYDRRPITFFLHPDESHLPEKDRRYPKHLRSAPAGVETIFTRDHTESWELLLS